VLPEVHIGPADGIELGLAALFLVGAALAARRNVRRADLPPLFATYFFGLLALVLLVHAFVGRAPLVVSTYSAILAVAVLAGWYGAFHRLRGLGLAMPIVHACLLGTLLFGLAGARLAQLIFAGSDAGLGVFGTFGAVLLFLWGLLRGDFARVCDACAAPMYLTFAIGKLGCIFAGCCFGAPTHAPLSFAVTSFAPSSPAGAFYRGSDVARIWTTQPLEAFVIAAIAAACEIAFRRRAALGLPHGVVAAMALGAYGIARFGSELLRADTPRAIAGVLTVWQLAAIAMATLALGWLVFRRASRSR
jgi:phosphatidylglycerol---prolipoprotein diacylglyceryl transferase